MSHQINHEPKKWEDMDWRIIRQIVLIRDQYKCQCKCTDNTGFTCSNDNKMMDVHHIIPKSRGGTNHIDNLITLCRNCHIEAQTEMKRILG